MKFHSYISALALSILTLPAFADEPSTLPKISGVIEVEAGFGSDDSDISLATFELGIAHSLNERAEAAVLFLYEQGENNDNIAVDTATITLHPTKQAAINIGRLYVPFGQFESNMVSDPLTLELGETQEEAIDLAFSSGAFSTHLYIFRDEEDGTGKVDDYGLSFGYENKSFATGISLISDVNEKSDATHSAKGFAIHAKKSIGRTTLIAEHLKVATTSDNDKPSATNLELGFDLGADRTLALALQKTKDADGAATDLVEKSLGIAYSRPIYGQVGFAAEVMKTAAYGGAKDTVSTLQLSYEF
ncbi:MAG: LbtU family siderophore porin [Thiotrichaceae bacterium]|nr:LbtU family siderophore porin [Thiotrichaceae bacterium]